MPRFLSYGAGADSGTELLTSRVKEKLLEDNKKCPASAPSNEPAPKHDTASLTSALGLCRGWGQF